MTDFTVVIPARYNSSRFPGKPLALIAGEPMIRHVHRRGLESGAARVVVATDDQRIQAACAAFGAEVVMTAGHHPSGTDRLAEVVSLLGLDTDSVIVNLQGDEPLMPPEFIRLAAAELHRQADAGIATLATAIRSAGQLHDPNVVKVVFDRRGRAMYFSRAPIPWHRDRQGSPAIDQTGEPAGYWRHLGLYAYRVGFLQAYPGMEPPHMEQAECLEQLRALWHGVSIAVATVTGDAGPGVDTPADLVAASEALETLRAPAGPADPA